jgi:hypothetical protein
MKLRNYPLILISVIIFACFSYIFIAYLSKQSILAYYKLQDRNSDWNSQFEFTPIHNKYRIVLIVPPAKYIADLEASNRIKLAAENLGWQVFCFESIKDNAEEIRKINPDFIFTSKWDLKLDLDADYHDFKIYALLAQPTEIYFGGFLELIPKFNEKRFPQLKYLDGFIISAQVMGLFRNYIEKNGKKFYAIKGFSSVPFQQYKIVEPNSLIYMGMNWDNNRNSNKYSKLFKILASKEKVYFYGSKEKLQPIVDDAFREFKAKSKYPVTEMLQSHGINLLLHNKSNLTSGVPSGRAFETAAASVIGITDRHPFIIENFSDSFLYVDVDASAERIAAQIHKHLLWIKENPDKAKAKAKKAHEIFAEKFTMENMMIKLARMHEKIILDQQAKR